ncbi:MAG: MBL fold metallo-hydrolase [Candidatus Helarchaeota archaeon]
MDWVQEEGKINENTYLIDSLLFGTEKSMSCFLIVGKKKRVLIDASGKSEGRRIAKKLIGMDLKPDILITTHSHWDHSGGISSIVKKISNIEIMAHKDGLEALANPNEFNKWFPNYTHELKPVNDVIPLNDRDILDLGDLELEILSTPGHTNCSICILDRKNKTLFIGDSLGYKISENIFFGPIMPPEFSEKKLLQSFEKVKNIDYKNICIAHFGYLTGNLAKNLPDYAKSKYFEWKNFFLNKWKKKPDSNFIKNELGNELLKKGISSEKAEIISEMFSDWIIKGLKIAKLI